MYVFELNKNKNKYKIMNFYQKFNIIYLIYYNIYYIYLYKYNIFNIKIKINIVKLN